MAFLLLCEDLGRSEAAGLHFDPDGADRQTAGGQMRLQGRDQLAQFGSHGIGADQQAPLPVFKGAGLDRSEQGAWQQLADRLQTAAGSLHAVNQPRQGRRLSGRLQKRYGGVAALCCGHGRRIIPQPRPGRARSVGSRPPCR